MRHTPSSRTTGLAVLFAGLFMLGTAHAAEYEVKMLNNGPDGMMVFEPGFLKIQPGDSVRFVPADPGHIVESYSVPAGGTTWISEFNQEITPIIAIMMCGLHL